MAGHVISRVLGASETPRTRLYWAEQMMTLIAETRRALEWFCFWLVGAKAGTIRKKEK